MAYIDDILEDVAERNPATGLDSIEFKAEVICLLLWVASDLMPVESARVREAVCQETGYDSDTVSGVLTSLEAGNALKDGQLHESIMEGLSGEISGTCIAILLNVALGRSIFHPDRGTYSLTEGGHRYVKKSLLKR